MATPLSAAAFLKALRTEGLTVVTSAGWETHNRNHRGPWGPVNGSMVHHTVTRGTSSTVNLVRHGYSTLPGPLCHGMISKNGTVYLVGYGRANHAGGGDPKVLDKVISEDYTSAPPPPTRGNSNGVDGNAHFYGFECENLGDGKDPWPKEQYDAIVRSQAAVIRAHRAKGDKWSQKSVIAHKEWSSDKIDPRGFSAVTLRADIAERLKHPAGWSPGAATVPQKPSKPTIPSEETSDVRPVDVWAYKGKGETRDAYAHLRDTEASVTEILREVRTGGLTDQQVNSIAKAVTDVIADQVAAKVLDALAGRLES